MYDRQIKLVQSLRQEFAIAAAGDFGQVGGLSLRAGQPPGARWVAYTERLAAETGHMVQAEHYQAHIGLAFTRYAWFYGNDVLPVATFWNDERRIDADLAWSALQRSGAGVEAMLRDSMSENVVNLEVAQDELSDELNMRRENMNAQRAVFDADEQPKWQQPGQAEIYFHALRKQQQKDAEVEASHLFAFAQASLGMAKFLHDDMLAKFPNHKSETALDLKQKLDIALGRGTKALNDADSLYKVYAPLLAAFGQRFDAARRDADPDPFAL